MGLCLLKASITFRERKKAVSRREVFDFFFFLLLISENISTNSQQKGRANGCFVHYYISHAWTIMRGPGFAALVRLAGLILRFSKPLRVGSGGLRAHGGDP